MPRVRHGDLDLLSDAEVNTLAVVTKALSDPIRLQMLYLLRQRPDLCTCEFEVLLDLGQSKVSYHLKILLDAGLATRESVGTWSHYRLRDSQILAQVQGLAADTLDEVVASHLP